MPVPHPDSKFLMQVGGAEDDDEKEDLVAEEVVLDSEADDVMVLLRLDVFVAELTEAELELALLLV